MARLAAALLFAGACAARPDAAAPACPDWRGDVAPLLAERCASCHPDLTTYAGALGDDQGARLVAALETTTHDGLEDAARLLETWVVECRLAYGSPAIHEPGILNPADADGFHGALLRRRAYDFDSCDSCHRADAEGRAGQPCATCHEDGPTACGTCHDEIPTTGAHGVHLLGGELAKIFVCEDCHTKPAVWSDPGHILASAGIVDEPPAEVTLATGVWDRATQTCSGVYCHGGAWNDANATEPVPAWTTSEIACGSCHGVPPSSHASAACTSCHPRVARNDGTLIDLALHLDGAVDLGDGRGTCASCHPGATADGPHRSHLEARHRLGAPVACLDCHQVPAAVTSSGHVDSEPPVELFPAAIATQSLAFANGSSPTWDGGSGTCSGVYCHGDATPTWRGVEQAVCGTCHGVPPADGNHAPGTALDQCATCHPATVDPWGNILVDGSTSRHIDGAVDAP